MNVQFQEETAHAMKFFAYVTERGGRVQLEAIEKPQTEWPSALAMFEHALQHEQKVTGMIDALADLALELKDHATHNLLQWFIAEQVEEEANATEMVQKLTLAKDSPAALFNIDRDMAARVFVPPTATA
jgi:ferritin